MGLLDMAGLPFWLVPQTNGTVDLCLTTEHRQAVLDLLRELDDGAWYYDELLPTGSGRQRPRAVRHRGRGLEQAPGLVVFEVVVPSPRGTFVAAEPQGVRILFWHRQSRHLQSLVANTTAEVMPPGFDPRTHQGRVPEFLVGRRSAMVDFPIDAVYTWVDGDDDRWLLDKARAAGAADSAAFTERAHDASRYADHDELRYSLRALEQFAPWVNHVWVVTADQHPSWLAKNHPWVTVVSHRDVWPDGRGLPTFNSHAIETCLHRIPGLSEHFVYLNDDMVIGRPVRPEQFFHANGIGKFFWSKALVDHAPSQTGDVASTTAARNARRLLERDEGTTFTRKFFHTAAALTVSGLTELEARFPEVVAATRTAQFRTLDDVAMAGSFYLNWAYVTGRSVPGSLRYTYVDPALPDAAHRLAVINRARSFDALCVNDGSSSETVAQRRQTDALIRRFFACYLPVPGRFEVPSP